MAIDIKELPNIYTVLEKMNFEEQSEHLERGILRIQNLDNEARVSNRKQLAFSIIQKFYEALLENTDFE